MLKTRWTKVLTKLIIYILGEKESHRIYKAENMGLRYTDGINIELRLCTETFKNGNGTIALLFNSKLQRIVQSLQYTIKSFYLQPITEHTKRVVGIS